MKRSICPYLGTLDKHDRPGPAVDYPSLENQCFAVAADELLLLADQATFCLSGESRYCPRYQNAQRATSHASADDTAANSAWFEHEPAAQTQTAFEATRGDEGLFGAWAESFSPPEADQTKHRWVWAGVALLFASLLLCGGAMAAYTGWQFVSARYLVAASGEISTMNANAAPSVAPSPTPAPQYLIVTATSAAAPALAPPPENSSAVPQTNFPAAVTPTPILVNPAQLPPSSNNGTVITANSASVAQAAPAQNDLDNSPQDIALPTAAVNLQVEVPTRRPTPLFEVPTSTPEAAEVAPPPTATPTLTPVLGPPVVVFEPFQYALQNGQCTMVRWHVENVQAVFYENQGVNGDGQKEECMDDEPRTYTLAVVLPDGSTSVYTTTVDYLPPTPTLTPTPSFTPIRDIEPTPTWTPDVPTQTPTPRAIYGVGLSIFGEDRHSCSGGSTCEFDILVSNTGNAVDTLSLTVVQSGPWPALLCVDGGSCSGSALTLANINAGESKLAKLKISVASDAAAQNVSYGLQAISNGSGGSVTSSVETVEVQVP